MYQFSIESIENVVAWTARRDEKVFSVITELQP